MLTHPMVYAWTGDMQYAFARNPFRAYIGHRSPHACVVTYHPGSHVLPPRLDVRNHSPAGYQWGYGGSGPAQLALAILMHASGDNRFVAMNLYQHFKSQVISTIDYDSWLIRQSDVIAWMNTKDPK